MRWMIPLAAILCLQDTSPVSELMSRIDGTDPDRSFKAIAELADLEAKYQGEIRQRAGKLPEFYRDALVAELNASSPRSRRR